MFRFLGHAGFEVGTEGSCCGPPDSHRLPESVSRPHLSSPPLLSPSLRLTLKVPKLINNIIFFENFCNIVIKILGLSALTR